MQGFSIANNRLWGVRQEERGGGGQGETRLVFFFPLFFYFYVQFLIKGIDDILHICVDWAPSSKKN